MDHPVPSLLVFGYLDLVFLLMLRRVVSHALASLTSIKFMGKSAFHSLRVWQSFNAHQI